MGSRKVMNGRMGLEEMEKHLVRGFISIINDIE